VWSRGVARGSAPDEDGPDDDQHGHAHRVERSTVQPVEHDGAPAGLDNENDREGYGKSSEEEHGGDSDRTIRFRSYSP